jgi:hypothetical protein
MDGGFDPYHKWLGISAKDQPPNYYRLLGIDLFESDPDVIVATFNRQRAHLLTYQNGPYKEYAQRIMQEVIAARACLSDPLARQAYDAQLQLTAAPEAAPAEEPTDFREMAASPRRSSATRSPRPPRNIDGSANPDDPSAPQERLWLGIGRQGQIVIVSVGSVIFVLTMAYLLFGGGSSKSRTQTESVPQSFPNVQNFKQSSPTKTTPSKPNTSKSATKPKRK